MGERLLIIPAAGRGSRLGSRQPKPLVVVAGKPMLDHLFDLYAPWVGEFVVIVNPESESAIRSHCARRGERVSYERQDRPTGMLDAIQLATPRVEASPTRVVWITWADQIAVRGETVRDLASHSDAPGTAMALPTLRRSHPYTHLERDAGGRITGVRYRREADPMPEVGESEIGVFSVRRDVYLDALPDFAAQAAVLSGAATGERNFLPFIPWLAARDSVVTFPCREDIEAVGVNTPEELARVEAALAARVARR